MDFTNKKVLVCGIERSGRSAANLLVDKKAQVTAQDLKSQIKPFNPSVSLYLGKNPDDIVQEFDLIVVSPGIPTDLPFLKKARENNIPIWGEIELAYRFCLCSIMAITGTNGKTTVTTLAGNIIHQHNNKTEILGNIGVPFTEKVNSLTVDSFVVAEVSSFQLETIHSFSPKISAVLNVTPDHLDRHKTMENYAKIKERIFMNQSPNDFTILGYDNALCRKMKPTCNTVYFSVKELLKTGVFVDKNIITARMFDKEYKLADVNKIKILPENACAIAALCLCADVPPVLITESFLSFKGVPHRIEYVAEINGIEFYNDSKATNTDSAIKGIEAMKRPVVLIAGGYDKKADFGEWIKHFGKKVKYLIVMGETADQITETCKIYSYTNVKKASSLEEAVDMAYKKAQTGDAILLSPACASWDMFDNFEQRGNIFKELVNKTR